MNLENKNQKSSCVYKRDTLSEYLIQCQSIISIDRDSIFWKLFPRTLCTVCKHRFCIICNEVLKKRNGRWQYLCIFKVRIFLQLFCILFRCGIAFSSTLCETCVKRLKAKSRWIIISAIIIAIQYCQVEGLLNVFSYTKLHFIVESNCASWDHCDDLITNCKRHCVYISENKQKQSFKCVIDFILRYDFYENKDWWAYTSIVTSYLS